MSRIIGKTFPVVEKSSDCGEKPVSKDDKQTTAKATRKKETTAKKED